MSSSGGGPPPPNIGWEAPPSFDELYDRYRAAVYGFACYLTRDRGEAEDLFQEAWVRIVRHLPERVNMESLKTWIFTIVANLHRDLLRKRRVRTLFLKHAFGEAHHRTERPPATAASPEREEPYLQELGRDIARAIDRLPEKQRRVFVLKEISGFKQAEISDILGMPVGTVKSLMHRAVRRLQRDLADYRPNALTEGVKNAM